jgi:hypothetical protein
MVWGGNDCKFQGVYYHPDFWVIYRIMDQRLINTSIFTRKEVELYHPYSVNPNVAKVGGLQSQG